MAEERGFHDLTKQMTALQADMTLIKISSAAIAQHLKTLNGSVARQEMDGNRREQRLRDLAQSTQSMEVRMAVAESSAGLTDSFQSSRMNNLSAEQKTTTKRSWENYGKIAEVVVKVANIATLIALLAHLAGIW
jgi:uncharacterized coiled-coil protein SlyX